jgi:hypothetical protein
MAFWDSNTHMSKPEWRETCQRTLQGIELLGGIATAKQDTSARRTNLARQRS